MIKYIKRLFCSHAFKEIGKATIIRVTNNGVRSTTGGTNMRNCTILRCQKCHKTIDTQRDFFVNNIRVKNSSHYDELLINFRGTYKTKMKFTRINYSYYLTNKKYNSFEEIENSPVIQKEEYSL